MFLVIHGDKPIFQIDLVPSSQRHIKEYFLIHSSLDTIDMNLKSRKDYYMGQVKSDDTILYAYVNSIQIRMLLVLGQKKEIDKNLEKNIKEFFNKANQALAVAFLNPLYRPKDYIRSPIFQQKIKTAVKQSLRAIFDKRK